MKWLKEIKAVGLRDWMWFVFCLRRNEFNPKLDLRNYPFTREGQCRLIKDKAHNINNKLTELKYKS